MTRYSVRTKQDKWGNPDSFAVAVARDQQPAPPKPPVIAVFVVNPFANEAECRVYNEVQRKIFGEARLIVLSAAMRKDRGDDPKAVAPEVVAVAYADHVEPPTAYAHLPRVAR
jgi:hypothetical protein